MLTKRNKRALTKLVGVTGLAVAVLGTAVGPASAQPARAKAVAGDVPRTWVVDANTMHTPNIQEDGIFSDGDEPYIAVIGFRSRFATPGSSNAVYRGGLRELSSGADDGDTLGIPDSQGRMAFPSVQRLSAVDIGNGFKPEIIGTITIAMESDATPFSSMDSIFGQATTVVKQVLAATVEKTSLADVLAAATDPVARQKLVDRLSSTVKSIASQAEPSVWQKLGIFLSSFGDPDDKIAIKASAFLTVDSSLASLVDANVPKFLTPDLGFGGALRARTYSQEFKGDGARYVVDYAVS